MELRMPYDASRASELVKLKVWRVIEEMSKSGISQSRGKRNVVKARNMCLHHVTYYLLIT